MQVLKLSKGIVRVPLEDLGPALFNRQGAATCGQHCQNLGKRILTLEGFATFRYQAGFCHEPDPDDPMAVSRHGNNMTSIDPLLPRLPQKPLKGVFAKTHLVTFLQMYKNGQMPDLLAQASSQLGKAPGQEGQLTGAGMPSSEEELRDVLEHGIFMHVFPWWAVRDHKEAVTALMASDNFDHGHGLADSEIRCIVAVRAAITASSQGKLPIPQGSSQWEVVRRYVLQMSGQRWREQDIGFFWDFAKSTLEGHLAFLQEVWNFAGCESVLRVEAAFFGGMSKVPAKLQWTRVSFVIAHFLSDRDKECSVVGGHCIAGAITKAAAKKVRERDAALGQDWEEWLSQVMDKYWTPWDKQPFLRPIARANGLKGIAAFLCRAGRYAAYSTMADMADQKQKLETKLRASFEPAWQGAFPEPLAPALSQESTKPNSAQEWDDQPLLEADSGGKAVVSAKRQAQDNGLVVGATVVAKRFKGEEGQDTVTATIIDITGEGLAIKWENDEGSQTSVVNVCDASLVSKRQDPAKKKKDTASSQDAASSQALGMAPVKWSPCSTAENTEMLIHLTMATLYQAYVARSTAHEDLHIIHDQEGVKLHANKEIKANALALLPFGALEEAADKKIAAFAPVAIEIGSGATASSQETSAGTSRAEYRLRAKTTPKRTTGTQDKAVALVPFWVLATKTMSDADAKASGAAMCKLEYTEIALPVLPPQIVGKKASKDNGKTKVVVKTFALMNTEIVPKGSQLYVADKPPAAIAV